MEYNKKEDLQKAINLIKEKGIRRGLEISEEEIVNKMDISKEKLFAYLNGEQETPHNLIIDMLSLYGIGIKKVNSRTVEQVIAPPDEEVAGNE